MGSERARRWWGRWPLAAGQTGVWSVGSLSLWLRRGVSELRIADLASGDGMEERLEVQVPGGDEVAPVGHRVTRLAVGSASPEVILEPLLADRPVVARPEIPLAVPPGGEARVFVSHPLWLRVRCGDAAFELPTFRPVHTWFGPSTREGTLCYATRTKLRVDLANVPVRPHRSISSVLIRNFGHDPLSLQRLRLPAPQLSLYVGADEGWATQDLTMTREADSDEATVRVSKEPPTWIDEAVEVAPPREAQASLSVLHVFNSLFN